MRDTDFSKFIFCIEPLKEEKEAMPDFINRIFVEFTPYSDDVPEIDIKRANPTLSKYAYGTSDISKSLASDLLKAKDEDEFALFLGNTSDSISQLILENLEKCFYMQDLTLHNFNVKGAELFTKILEEAASKTNKKSIPSANVDDFIKKPYIENEMLVIGDARLPLPVSKLPNSIIPEEELKLKYLFALIDAYNDAEGSKIDISNIDTFKKKYRENFQEQRVNFYEADCLKTFSRDTLRSSSDEFQKLLDDTYDGVINTNRKNYQDGYSRLLAVLEQAALINLDSSQLYSIPGMVNNKRKLGFCHMLVNDNKLVWIDEED
ncbi:MAG: hypothetical protein Q4E02_05565 [Lagierella massiliensis]|nr:hypothetical protein [Lagierella massiliensis]